MSHCAWTLNYQKRWTMTNLSNAVTALSNFSLPQFMFNLILSFWCDSSSISTCTQKKINWINSMYKVRHLVSDIISAILQLSTGELVSSYGYVRQPIFIFQNGLDKLQISKPRWRSSCRKQLVNHNVNIVIIFGFLFHFTVCKSS